MISISADVGGTFTDIILADGRNQKIYAEKVLSTPGSSQAIINGIVQICDKAGLAPSAIDVFVHGFTIATNAWLTRSGARVALAVTQGFRDVLEIGTQRRLYPYSLQSAKPAPLVPTSQVVQVNERLDAFGGVVQPFTADDAKDVAQRICALDPQAVAISFLFSYLNPQHENLLEAALHELRPDLPVYKSSAINPQAQEYPRTNTTVTSAYVGPVVDKYLDDLEASLPRIGMTAPLLLMRSDGGVATVRAAKQQPVNMLLSGPAGGVVAGLAISHEHDAPNIITFDMGGTSADFSLISEGRTLTTTERVVAGDVLRMTALDIATISAGGGSIGRVDMGGAIRVGPESAGSTPGPVCYGRGGALPTLTDAALVIGLFDKNTPLANGMRLDFDQALAAVRREIGEKLGVSPQEAAFGMIAIANAQMAQAIRSLSVEKGFDVRRFALLSFGGAGALFAPFLMQELDMQEIMIPARPGVFSASGLLLSDIKYNLQAPYARPFSSITVDSVTAQLNELAAQAHAAFERDGVEADRREFHYSADVRYEGQVHELIVPLDAQAGGVPVWNSHDIALRFVRQHEQTYGFSDMSMPCEVVNLRLEAVGRLARPNTEETATVSEPGLPVSMRAVYLGPELGLCDTAIYRREDLAMHQQVPGPAVITQSDTTILVLPGQTVTVGANGLLRITNRAMQEAAVC